MTHVSPNLVVATERTESRDRFMLKSVDFGRFMTSEGTETLILAFTSKTGQSVAHNRHFGFFCQRLDIRHFNLNFRLQSPMILEILKK